MNILTDPSTLSPSTTTPAVVPACPGWCTNDPCITGRDEVDGAVFRLHSAVLAEIAAVDGPDVAVGLFGGWDSRGPDEPAWVALNDSWLTARGARELAARLVAAAEVIEADL